MKRSVTLLLSLALVLAFSFVAYGASASVSISGEIEFDAYLRQKWDGNEHGDLEFFAQGRRHATLSFSTGNINQGNLRLVMGFNTRRVGDNGANAWEPWSGDVYRPSYQNYQFGLTSARLEARGALWKGGDNIIVVLGRYNPGLYSPWIAHNNRVRGNKHADYPAGTHRDAFMNSIEIRDLKVGPFTVKAVHGYATAVNGPPQRDQPTWINAKGKIGEITADVTAVNRGIFADVSADDYKHVWDFAVSLEATPVKGLDLNGTVAIDGQGQGYDVDNPTTSADVEPKMAFEVGAKLTTVPNLTLNGTIFRADDGFAPRYAQWDRAWEDYKEDEIGNYVAFRTNRQGVKVGAETEVAGLKLTGGFTTISNAAEGTAEYSEQVLEAGVSTKIENFDVGVDFTYISAADEAISPTHEYSHSEAVLKVGTSVSTFDVNYTGTFATTNKVDEDAEHKLEVETTRDLFFADKVTLNGTVILRGDEVDYGIDASWKAPNDLNFVVGYANYKKSPRNAVHGHQQPDGFYIRTYATIKF